MTSETVIDLHETPGSLVVLHASLEHEKASRDALLARLAGAAGHPARIHWTCLRLDLIDPPQQSLRQLRHVTHVDCGALTRVCKVLQRC